MRAGGGAPPLNKQAWIWMGVRPDTFKLGLDRQLEGALESEVGARRSCWTTLGYEEPGKFAELLYSLIWYPKSRTSMGLRV